MSDTLLPLFNLAGLRALVTGSSQGIGFALARGLAEHGCEIVLNGREASKLSAATSALVADGHRASAVAFDVTRPAEVRPAVAKIEETIGPIDILVNNAGMQFRSPLEDYPSERWDQLLATNVSSVFHVSQAVARRMIDADEARS